MDAIETNQEEAAESQPEQLIESSDETHVSRPAAASRALNEDEVVTHRVTPPFARILAWIIGILIVAFLIILFARWVYHKAHHTVQTVPANTKQLPNRPSGTSNQKGQNSQTANNSSSSSNPSASSQNTNLPNSGPGQTMAIFAGASLSAAGIHYIITERRTTKQP